MPQQRVSIRLGTDGKAQVQKDLADIGTTGDAASKRIATAFERDSALAEAALAKLAKTQERFAAVSASPLQQTINRSTGIGPDQTGTARASAQALAQQLDAAEREARELIASIDPLFAAQARYEAQVARINAVKATGQLDEQRYQQLMAREQTVLDQATAAQLRHGASSGSMRMGMQQLSFQIGDVSQQLALGVRGSIIFAQQSGQVIQALQLMGGQGNAFLRFLGGPWGIALSAAAVVITPLIGKLFDTGENIDSLVEKLRKEARQAGLNDEAHRAFEHTLDGVTDALRKNRDALKGMADEGKTAADRALDLARAQLAQLDVIDRNTRSTIAQAKAQLELNNSLAMGAETKGHVDPRLVAAGEARGRLAALEATLPDIAAQVTEARRQIDEAASHVAVESAMRDAAEQIKRTYEGPNGLVEQTRRRLLNEKATTAEIERQVRVLHDREQAEIKAAQEHERKGPSAGSLAHMGGDTIQREQIASFFDIANRYRGKSETGDKAVLESFFRAANQKLDPEKTAWCAAFVNAVLATGGVSGSGSLAARSFLTYGKDDMTSPQKGDIVILKGAAGDHVGFLDSIDKKGNVRVLAGNTGNRVAEATYSANSVLGIRRPPTPGEQASSDVSAAEDAARDLLEAHKKQAGEFASEIEKGLRQYDELQRKAAEDVKRRAEAYDKVIEGQQDSLALLQAEAGMAGLSERQREEKLRLLQMEIDLNHELGPEYAARIKEIVAQAAAQDKLRERIEQVEATMDEFRHAGEQVLDEIFNIDNWSDWGDAGKHILHELEQEFITLAALNPLKNMLFGGNLPTLASAFAGILGGVPSLQATNPSAANYIPPFPGNASGTESFAGGYTWVGEFGKELVRLPRGSQITPAGESRRIAAANDVGIGAIHMPINIDATGADPAGLARVEMALGQMQAELPYRVVEAYYDAVGRNVIR